MEALCKATDIDLLSIRDVAKLCDVPAHTIRFWEKEFSEFLAPGRTLGKQRRYTEDDMNRILRLKKLLWEEKYSIEGARRILKGTVLATTFTRSESSGHDSTHDLAVKIARLIEQYSVAGELTI